MRWTLRRTHAWDGGLTRRWLDSRLRRWLVATSGSERAVRRIGIRIERGLPGRIGDWLNAWVHGLLARVDID